MSSPSLTSFFVVEIDFLHIEDATTKTVKVCNRVALDATAGDYFPILDALEGVGVAMGTYLPDSSRGAIKLNNKRDSFGYERRISDLLARYTLQQQQVRVFAAQTTVGDYDIAADLAEIWRGNIQRYRYDTDILTLSLESQRIPKRTAVKIINSVDFPDAPSGSLGQSLPIVFGSDVEVQGIRIAEATDSVDFAYATTLSDQHVVGGVQSYYAQDADGIYREVKWNATASTTDDFALNSPTHTTTPSRAGVGTVTAITAHAWAANEAERTFMFWSDEGAIITHGAWYWDDTGNAARDGIATMRIYENQQQDTGTVSPAPPPSGGGWGGSTTEGFGPPAKELANGVAAFASATLYSTHAGPINTYVTQHIFNQPVVLKPGIFYSVGISRDPQGGADNMRPVNRTGHTLIGDYNRDTTAAGQAGWYDMPGPGVDVNAFSLFGLALSDTPTPVSADINTSDGLGHAYFTAEKWSDAAAASLSLDNLSLIATINGLQDDSSGTFTGTATQQLNYTDECVGALLQTWDGSDWTPNIFDQSQWSATHVNALASGALYERTITGASVSRVLVSDLISDLMRNSGCRLGVFRSGDDANLGVWAWGTAAATAAVITDDDFALDDVQVYGTETVVNRATSYYKRRLSDRNLAALNAEGLFKDYTAAMDSEDTTNLLKTVFTRQSQDKFGILELRDQTFDFVDDSASMQNTLRAILSRQNEPWIYVTGTVPFFKYDDAIDLLDVIEFKHPGLPGFFGTSPAAQLPLEGTDEASADLLLGYQWRRAFRYRGQVESRELVYKKGAKPRLKLTVRLLNQHGGDPI